MTMIIAYERYMALATLFSDGTRPFGFSGKMRALKIFSMVVLGSLIYNFPWFFTLRIKEESLHPHNNPDVFTEEISENTTALPSNTTRNCLEYTQLRLNKHFILWYVNACNSVLTGGIPFLCLLIFNRKIITKIRQLSKESEILVTTGTISLRNGDQRKNQKLEERRRAVVMFVIVIAFLFLHSLRSILNIEEIVMYEEKEKTLKRAKDMGKMCRGMQFWYLMAIDYSHLLLVLNASINFLLYGLFGKQFRDVMKEKIRCIGKFFSSCKIGGKDKQNDTEIPAMKP
jgi:hypothetical protein